MSVSVAEQGGLMIITRLFFFLRLAKISLHRGMYIDFRR